GGARRSGRSSSPRGRGSSRSMPRKRSTASSSRSSEPSGRASDGDGSGRMSRHPHVLEFVGRPGAGKTTLARRLTAGLAAEGIRCAAPRLERIDVPARGARRFARGAHRVATYAATPVLSATVLRFGFSIRPLRPARAKWLRDVLDTVRGVASSAPDRELILLDQGVLQALWSAS